MGKQNVVRFQSRSKIKINIGIVIFSLIAIYVVICTVIYLGTKKVIGYEVMTGSLSVTNTYTGIALRAEETVNATSSGYVNYFAREGKRAAYGDLIYSLDESGKLSELLKGSDPSKLALNDSNLRELKADIVSFSKSFQEQQFSGVYDFSYLMESDVVKLANSNALAEIDTLSSSSISDLVNLYHSDRSGYVAYYSDGFENKLVTELTMDNFDKSMYEKKQFSNDMLVNSGDMVLKYIRDESWSIVIPIEKERAAKLLEEEYVKVRFLKNQNESWAQVNIVDFPEYCLCELKLNNSVSSFCSDRFIDVEIISAEESGLKIPNSSIVEKEFYLIPTQYAQATDQSDVYDILRETYLEDGTVSSDRISISVYNMTDTEFYVDMSQLRTGDTIIAEPSGERYPISKKGSLIGVYNINKGYADFRQISILYQNDEYSIVKSNTEYGLRSYDYIVLDSTSVNEDDFVYE